MILLDTHAVLWWQAGSERLSATARRTIAAAGTILVSPVSFWEIALLVAKGRIGLDRTDRRLAPAAIRVVSLRDLMRKRTETGRFLVI